MQKTLKKPKKPNKEAERNENYSECSIQDYTEQDNHYLKSGL